MKLENPFEDTEDPDLSGSHQQRLIGVSNVVNYNEGALMPRIIEGTAIVDSHHSLPPLGVHALCRIHGIGVARTSMASFVTILLLRHKQAPSILHTSKTSTQQ